VKNGWAWYGRTVDPGVCFKRGGARIDLVCFGRLVVCEVRVLRGGVGGLFGQEAEFGSGGLGGWLWETRAQAGGGHRGGGVVATYISDEAFRREREFLACGQEAGRGVAQGWVAWVVGGRR